MAEYIDRQAALDELDEDIEEFVECDYALKTAKKYIKKIPPADVRPVVHSEWVLNDNGTWSCNYCKSWIPDEQRFYANWCLYCGAKMEE